jgi:hypothetical protein
MSENGLLLKNSCGVIPNPRYDDPLLGERAVWRAVSGLSLEETWRAF